MADAIEHVKALMHLGGGGAPKDDKDKDKKDRKLSEGTIALEVLKAHNRYRVQHGVPEMSLDQHISTISQNWADELLRQNRIVHSPHISTYGENIFHAHGKANIPPKRCVKSWYNEGKKFDWSKIAHQRGTGHYTQIIWKTSVDLGVGYSSNATGTFLVCNYYPPGNSLDDFPANLLPPLEEKTSSRSVVKP